MTPARAVLSLAELVLVARMAGDLPLPFAPPVAGRGRMATRLAGTRAHRDQERLAAELARVDDDGPSGAAAALAGRGLLTEDGVDPRLTASLRALAGAPLVAVLDLVVDARPLRAWWGAGQGVLSGLVLRGATTLEVVSAPVSAWAAEIARLVPAGPAAPPGDRATMASEDFLGALAAHRRGRPDLAAALVPDHAELVRGLAVRCRGRLRLLVVRRHADAPPAMVVWVLLDDGWRSLRPLRGARVEVAGRRPVDLGSASWPWLLEVA